MELPPRVLGVDQLARVNAYYGGRWRVNEASLLPPTRPFFCVSGSNADDAADDSSHRARKKRKRQHKQQQQQQQLIASGKFVPVDPHVIEMLQRAHETALKAGDWKLALTDDQAMSDGDGAEDTMEVEEVTGDSHSNDTDTLQWIKHGDRVCVMPPMSTFVIGDVRVALHEEAAAALGTFPFIVMDPPWENKSVDRKRCYVTFHHRELLKLSMESLASTDDGDGCVLAIWVTNRPTYTAFILEELLPHWGFDFHATWYWLKVCKTGELVSPLSSPHRLPFEKLLVATRSPCAASRERLRSRLGARPRVLVSVPLRHSWKPPPESFFSGDDDGVISGRRVEIFARELRPHFVSVGNEPLKFQTARHFNTLTPTRHRRRGAGGVVESWSDAQEQSEDAAPVVVALPPHARAADASATAMATATAATTTVETTNANATATPAAHTPEMDRPELLGETQSVETIQAATELLQRLDSLQAELERTAQLGVDDIHLVHDYRAACAELITQFPWLALAKDIDQRLWSSWQRELAALESRLASATAAKSDGEMKLRDALYVALRNYSALIQAAKTARTTSAAGGVDTTTALVIHRLSLAHAHVMYALEIHSTSHDKKNWRMPELYYERARRWCVAQGETHYHLARIVLHDGRCAEALYHLVRSRVAGAPFASPGSLADQYAHVSSLRSSSSSSSSSTSEDTASQEIDNRWLQLDSAVLAAAAPYFGQQQEFMARRRTPRELSLVLCALLDTVCADVSADEDNAAAASSTQLVRVVGLLIACACVTLDVVQSPVATAQDPSDVVAAVKNPRAVELVVAAANGLLHRVLSAITSPLRTTKQKEAALQLMLPPVNVAFTWLLTIQWRDMVAESTRSSCEQLSTMVLTGIIAGGFLAPHEDLSASLYGRPEPAAAASGAVVPLTEDVELAGFLYYPTATATDSVAAAAAASQDIDLDVSTDSELLQRRIVKFLSHVEAFMTPRPAAAAVIAVAETPPQPSIVSDAFHALAAQLDQASLDTTEPHGEAANAAETPVTARRELWTPAKLSSSAFTSPPPAAPAAAAASTAKSKTKLESAASNGAKPVERVVVLDAANIAMRHGLQRRFSCRGIQLCAEFFIAQGDRVVAFLPDYCLDVDADGSFRRRVAASGGGGRGRRRESKCTITPDDRVLLEILVDSGVVVLTPAMDSDDLYCIHYARRHDAFLVTNDLFRDHISDTDGPKSRQTELRNWLQARRISYTWVGDEFLPNPNSAYEKMRLTAGR